MPCSFWGTTALVAVTCGRIAVCKLIWPVAASLVGVSIALPLLVVQFELSRGMKEKSINAWKGIEQGLIAMLAPYPVSSAKGFMPRPSNRDNELDTEWYYAGTLLTAAGFVVLGAVFAIVARPMVGEPVDRRGDLFAVARLGTAGSVMANLRPLAHNSGGESPSTPAASLHHIFLIDFGRPTDRATSPRFGIAKVGNHDRRRDLPAL